MAEAFAQPAQPIITLSCKTTDKIVEGKSSTSLADSGSIVVNLAKGTVSGPWQGPVARITHVDDVEIFFEGKGPDGSYQSLVNMSIAGRLNRVDGKLSMTRMVTPPGENELQIIAVNGTVTS